MNISKKHFLSLSIALALAGCGGGGGSSSPSGGSSDSPSNDTPNTDDGNQTGSETTLTSSGVITGFGSIYVNGVRFDTADAEIEFENLAMATEEDLRLGMRVEVEASRNGDERRAQRVFFDRDLKGPVSQVDPDPDDPALGSLTVLGQTVVVDANTVFDDDTPDLNEDGKIDIRDLDATSGRVVVEVSGFPTEEGLVATRIERINQNDSDEDNSEVEVKGFITDLDNMAGSFRIRALTVSFDASTLDDEDDFPEGGLSDGMFVEVDGQLLDDGSLEAEKIEREDDRFDDDELDGELEVEGILQAVDTESTPNSVTINGITIRLADASAFIGLEGAKLEVEGAFDQEGLLVLDDLDNDDDDGFGGIKFERGNNVRIEDRVETVGENSFTTRLGLEITPTGRSRVEDDSDDDGDRLTPQSFLSRLQMGDVIEARGFVEEDGSVTWTRVKRDDDDDLECELQGPVDTGSIDVTNGTFAVLGVTIETRMVDDEDFEGDDDAPLGRDQFFAQLTGGVIVETESIETGDGCTEGLLQAGELEFELDDDLVTDGPDDDSDSDDDSDDDSDSDDDDSDEDSDSDDDSETTSL